jgi:outer membrane immunogenic protein
MKMKKILLGVVGLAMGVAPAFGADLAARHMYTKAPPIQAIIYDWSGFYVGLNGGGAWSRNCWSNLGLSEGCNNASGGTIGGQIGYRWQMANWVFGLEGQGNWADLRASNTSLLFAPLVNQTKVDAFGLITGQVGYAWNNVLAYVKGGAAVTDNRYNGLLAGVVFDQASESRWGGTVGAGIEVGFAPSWSVGFEYDHLFMGNRTLNFTSAGVFTRADNIKQDVDLATVRVNYRWGGPVIAKY